MKNRFLCTAVLFAVAFATPLAHAESITYTFTGSRTLAGSDFTYVDPNGFLTLSSTQLAPTTAGDLIYAGVDYGPIFGFEFASSDYYIFGDYGTAKVGPISYDLDIIGPENLAFGTLDIEPTPEPTSLLLLATGGMALLGASRRRLFKL